MNKLLIVATLAAFTAFGAKKDAYDIRPDAVAQNAALPAEAWQASNRVAIAEATAPEALDAFLVDEKAAAELLAAVKTGYQTCPMKAVQIAAVSQYVMRQGECPLKFLLFWRQTAADQRVVWSEALLKAAEAAEAPDVKVFYLDQLRWCGRPCQADKVSKLQSPKCKCVKQMAEIVSAELRQAAE